MKLEIYKIRHGQESLNMLKHPRTAPVLMPPCVCCNEQFRKYSYHSAIQTLSQYADHYMQMTAALGILGNAKLATLTRYSVHL